MQLAWGDWSRHFIDAKRALARGSGLQRAAVALCDLATEMGVGFDAVGGPTMGADPVPPARHLLGSRHSRGRQ